MSLPISVNWPNKSCSSKEPHICKSEHKKVTKGETIKMFKNKKGSESDFKKTPYYGHINNSL